MCLKAAVKLLAIAGEAVLYIVYCCYRASCPTSCSFCWWKLLSNCSLLQEKLFYTLSTVVTGQAVLQAGPAAVCATIPNTHPSDPSLQVTRIGNIQSRGAVDALFASTVWCVLQVQWPLFPYSIIDTGTYWWWVGYQNVWYLVMCKPVVQDFRSGRIVYTVVVKSLARIFTFYPSSLKNLVHRQDRYGMCGFFYLKDNGQS